MTSVSSMLVLRTFHRSSSLFLHPYLWFAPREGIGIINNEQNDCGSSDSRTGFGTEGYPNDSNTCGNEETHSPDNENKHTKSHELHPGALRPKMA